MVVDSPVVIDQGCEGGASKPLAPSFRAGVQNVTAGAGGTFTLAVGREDQTQELKGLESIQMPAGLLGLRVGSTSQKAKVPAEMKDGGHPGLTARLAMPAGQANTKKAVVALPLSLALDPDNANGLCEPSEAAAEKCPEKSIVGSAEGVSPLLAGKLFIPLTASAYPGLQINLHASSEVRDDRLVTTFDNLPDVRSARSI